MRMYMIRHGQSVANAKKLHAGWSQTPLSPKGEEDARALAEVLKGYAFDKVYSSDTLRAIQTQNLALPGADAVLSDLLREINVGELAGKHADDCLQEYGERYLTDKAAHDFCPYGGECLQMQMARVQRFMDTLAAENGENIAVFCHEGTIRCALQYAGDRIVHKESLKNCGVYVFERTDSIWQFVAEIGGDRK